MRKKQRGFTLIEVLIVVTLVVMLGSRLGDNTNSVRRAREATLKEDLLRLRDAIGQYYADKNKWPPALQDLVSDGYLRAIPEDPFTNSADTWQVDNADPDPGVDDVHSGSDETAMDGSKYSEWE